MKFRDIAQQIIYKIINPFVRFLIKIGVRPNTITTIGLILNFLATIVFIYGGENANRSDLKYIGWGSGLILFAGLFDMLDGQVARLGNMSSRFGALYDSVLDRYSELIMFFGICYYLDAQHYFLSSMSAFIALIGSMMVSYTRARAEGLGIECKGGLMQRPERIVVIGASGMICGIVGGLTGGNHRIYLEWLPFEIFETITIFTLPICIVAILSNITAIKRLIHCKNVINSK
ncbi:MAG: CDP-alcohol phosphatidyltransferase family protein [Bacteroidota bacterium]|nr:CDP-alcohol phosphatidyltransferase family protein [Bacteroidota bacterium]